MKHLILYIAIISFFTCKAQSPIVPLTERVNIPDNFNGAYFKDVDNDLNKFVGTWVYQSGNTSLTMTFEKLIAHFNGQWYDDELIGEYKYIENGIEIVNELPKLYNSSVNKAQHTMSGNLFVYKNFTPVCDYCTLNDIRVVLYFYDTDRKHLDSKVVLTHFVENGVEKLDVTLFETPGGTYVGPATTFTNRVPYGTYRMVKQ